MPSQQNMRTHLRQAASHCMCHPVVYVMLLHNDAEVQQFSCPIQPDCCRVAPRMGVTAGGKLIGAPLPFSPLQVQVHAGRVGRRAEHQHLRGLRRFIHPCRYCCGLLWQIDVSRKLSPAELRAVSGEHTCAVLVACSALTRVHSADTETDGQTRGLLARCRASEPGELMLGSAYPAAGSSELYSLRLSSCR